MMNSYDLFSAMSGASEDLVARSDFRVKRNNRGLAPVLAAAACLTIILFSIISIRPASRPDTLCTQPTISTSETVTGPAITESNQPLQLSGGDIGTLNIVQLSHTEDADTMPDFLMYINQEKYLISEVAGTYCIYPRDTLASQMTLTWQANVTLEDAAKQQAAELSSSMQNVSIPESDALIGGIVIRSSNGTEQDSVQTDVYITSDFQGGVFIFTLNYSQEGSDEHAIWFKDMLQTFEVITEDAQMPEWMTSLRSTVENLTSGFLKDDFSDMQDLMAENAEMYTYESDVHSDVRVLKTQYTVDNDTSPTSAHVSVRHKYLENDAYDYITMELTYAGGKWQVTWAGIER